jgi:putative lipoprotein
MCLTALAAAAMLAVVAGCSTGAATAMPDSKPPTAGWDPMLHDRVDAVPVTLAELAGTTWLAEDIDRRGVLDRAQSRLHVASDRAVDGNAGCNSFHGSAEVAPQGFQFGPLATTRKACSPALMDQERRFLDALSRVRSATMSHGLLFLRDAEGIAILRFSRLSATPQGS